ncbi:hypothetical protein M9H77_35426 [Catharanthus roseus]|uniref:Uncharacterized protein n=1 Tax=Catharanthus roseus TaxID=4058 RepID=A0ACB9ZRI6_CATRO|nr:hypothetical protein M9H77_35426 [Catharanthus roseus]
MGSGKQSNSDTTSDEDIDQPREKLDNSSGIGRSYECNYCKRGFTNAQALGGHMNIHRKDKAKAKQHQKNKQDSSSSLPNKLSSHQDYKYFAPHAVSSEYNIYNSGVEGGYMGNYHYFQGQNYYHQQYSHDHNLMPSCNNSHHEYHQYMGENLSLRIGPSTCDDKIEEDDDEEEEEEEEERVVKNIRKENDIDLELRLGHHHP